MFAAFEAGMDRIYAILRAICVVILVEYLILVLLQVFFRYVLNESLFWAEEAVRFSMVWSVLLGSALVARDRAHIRIDVVENLLPPVARRRLDLVLDVLMIVFMLILMVTGIQFAGRSMMQTSPSLDLPMWAVYGAIPIGALLQALFMASMLRRPATPHLAALDGEPV
ncbi:MAG: TRAP transporter small permease [Alphaproteobacteria bacterium]|nr:TRAP transporter small permease [Alphaproteobacteria bacterium]